MKLDKIAFARLVHFITEMRPEHYLDLEQLDTLIDIEVPEVLAPHVSEKDVNELLMQMNNPVGFICAIKAYRSLTGAGLKEAKEAVEKYRIIKPIAAY